MRKRLMASTAAIIIVGFLVAFALAAKLVQDQYQLEFTRRLDSILAMMESQVDDIGQEPQGFAVKIGGRVTGKRSRNSNYHLGFWRECHWRQRNRRTRYASCRKSSLSP